MALARAGSERQAAHQVRTPIMTQAQRDAAQQKISADPARDFERSRLSQVEQEGVGSGYVFMPTSA